MSRVLDARHEPPEEHEQSAQVEPALSTSGHLGRLSYSNPEWQTAHSKGLANVHHL